MWIKLVMKVWNYASSNNLNIDKSTFLTVVIGQITIYGIILAFYQFVASYQAGGSRYLGYNILEYYAMKKTCIFRCVISKGWFLLLSIVEVLYKPFITIYGNMFSEKDVCRMNFIWFSFVTAWLIFLVVLLYQCAQVILEIRLYSGEKISEQAIKGINETFGK